MKQMKAGIPSLFKGGTKHVTGMQATVLRNIEACKELSNITRTSMGPNGMNKMVINHLDKLFVTSDAATIMKEMEIAHAAAKMLVMASEMQEQEIGDGSNFVVVLAGELLSQAESLIEMGLHPAEIINGYQIAFKHAREILDSNDLVVKKFEEKDMTNRQAIIDGVKTAIASKQYGQQDFLAGLVADAAVAVMPKNPANFNVDNIRIGKLLGGNLFQSDVIRGVVVPHDTIGSTKSLKDAKVAVYTAGIEPAATETKGTVVISDAKELMGFNEGEERVLHETIKAIVDTGVKCILTSGSVSDLAKHFLDKYGVMTIKVSSQHDLRRLCRAVGATAKTKLETPSPEEVGFCSSIEVKEMGISKITVFSQGPKDRANIATILLRGSTNDILNDIERAVDDAVNVVKAMGRDLRFGAGAGAIDIELARRLAKFAESRSGLEQYAAKAFAEALEVVPRILAENAGMTGIDVISQLYAAHEAGNQKVGVDIENTGVRDVSADGVIDHLFTKTNGLRLAVDCVLTILRVDQIIMSKPAGGPKIGEKQGHWDDD